MELVLIVLGFLGFIAWRERQHALDLRAVAPRRGDGTSLARRGAEIVAARSRKEKPEKPRVISADDDAAWNEAHGFTPEPEEEGDES